MRREVTAELRGAGLFGLEALKRSVSLSANQPLLLVREPRNRYDTNAIRVHDILYAPVGYVAREVAAKVAPLMDAGEVWMAKVVKGGSYRIRGRRALAVWPVMLLWHDPPEQDETARESLALAASGGV
jgi:SWI/SNF-related matrix-associated actin-dependent regulator of chromatin subfamily A3